MIRGGMEQLQGPANISILIVTGILGQLDIKKASTESDTQDESINPAGMGFLSQYFPDATIKTFHGIKTIRQPANNGSLLVQGVDMVERGAELLRYLDTQRDQQLQDNKNTETPQWVFVCHDLGGCILEQALVLAHSEPYYHWVRQSTAATVFIDTPSSSLGRHERETLILHVLASLKSTLMLDLPSMITSLVNSTNKLRAWAPAIFEAHQIATFSSVKTLNCEIGEVMGMTGDEPAVKVIIEAIKQCLERRLDEANAADAKVLQTLSETQPNWHQSGGSRPPTTSTMNDWILETDWYQSWVESTEMASVLAISGPSGSGLSLLAANITQNLRDRGDIVLSFTFSEANKSSFADYPVRNMISSLCQQAFRPLFQSRAHMPLCSWLVEARISAKEATKGLLLSLVSTSNASSRISCVIHGIQSLQHEERVEALQDINSLMVASQSTIKVLLTADRSDIWDEKIISSPWCVIDLVKEQDTHNVMKTLAMAQLERLAATRPVWRQDQLQEKATKKLCSESTSVFELAQRIRFLETSPVSATVPAIHSLIERIPNSLEALFSETWRKLTRPRVVEVAAIPWIMNASRPLSTSELAICIALSMTADSLDLDQFKSHISWNPVDDLERTLGPMIRFVGDKVEFRHRAYAEFLRKRSGSDLPEDDHLYLLSECLKYLEIISKRWTSPDEQLGRYGLQKESGLVEYACLHWPHHHRLAKDKFEATRRTSEFLLNDEHFLSWSRMFDYYTNRRRQADTTKLPASPIEVASHFGLTEVVKKFLVQPGFYENSASQLKASLDFASRSGCVVVVHLLLRQGIQSPSALRTAARFGNTTCVRALIDAPDSKLDDTDDHGYTALLNASQGGYVSTVEELLSRGANVDAVTATQGLCALHLACRIGQRDIVERLMKSGASLTLQDKSGYSALMYAAEGGFGEIVEVLVSSRSALPLGQPESRSDSVDIKSQEQVSGCSPIDIDAINNDGNTAIHLAVLGNHRHTVNVLLKTGVTCSIKNINNFTPLHLAVQLGYLDVTKDLIKTVSEEDAEDEFMRFGGSLRGRPAASVLEIAVQNNHLDIIRALLGSSQHGNEAAASRAMSYACEAGHTEAALEILQWHKTSGPDGRAPLKDDNDNTALHIAVENDRLELVKKLLGADHILLESVNSQGFTPLHIAAQKEGTTMIQELKDHGANLTSLTIRGKTPLHIAAENGKIDSCRELLFGEGDSLESLRKLDDAGATPAYLAAQSGHFETVQGLLELDKEGAKERLLHLAVEKRSEELLNIVLAFEPDLDWKDETGNTALHLAIQNHNITMIEALHEKGASTSIADGEGRTPLFLAVAHEDLRTDTTRALLDLKDADLKVDEPCNEVTPFLRLCSRYPFGEDTLTIIEIARLLLERFPAESPSGGINVNIQHPMTGRAPLHYASDTHLDDLTLLLLSHGADPNKTNDRGSTPLLLAAEMGKLRSVEALIARGADPRHTNNSNGTALHRAANGNYSDCIRFLLDKGADPNQLNDWGYTPVGIAALNGYVECVREFLKHKDKQREKSDAINLSIKNNEGLCILGQAAEADNDDVVDMLLDAMEEKDVRLALRNSVVSGHSEALRVLLDKTTDNGAYKLDDERYGSLLGAAVVKQQGDVIDTLLEIDGIQVDKADKDGRTPLMYAVMVVDNALVERLLERGAKPNIRDGGNETPLSYAVKEGFPVIIKTLLEDGRAEPEQEDARGHNLLYWDCRLRQHGEIFDTINAILRESPEYVRLCSQAIHGAVAGNSVESLSRLLSVEGINANARDDDGWTPLDIAKCYSREHLEKMLTGARLTTGHDLAEPKMPTGWHLTDKACGLLVEKKGSHSVVKVAHPSYILDDDDELESTYAITRANHCLPHDQDWYFEVSISAPELPDEKNITSLFGIGVCEDRIRLDGMLGFGWSEDSLSFGYHCDDGDVYPISFRSSSRGMAGGQHFSSADSPVGCGFNSKEKTMYFTKNGEYLGIAFVDVPGARLYPAIFTSTSRIGLEFAIKFDSSKWKFDPKAPRNRVVGNSDEEDFENEDFEDENSDEVDSDEMNSDEDGEEDGDEEDDDK